MGKEKTNLFDNVLQGFEKEAQKLFKTRLIQRWRIHDEVIIDIKGQLISAKLIDASTKILRIDAEIPLNLQGNCIITFKDNPAVQLIGSAIITEKEFNQGFWNRLSLRATLDLGKFKTAA